ncbi:hypothetical protein C8R47DRAFT_1323496 [Mycena vitilis]|nr:hypothetical protein C8R47DRAFT_1323496 [Mycena vitilis]
MPFNLEKFLNPDASPEPEPPTRMPPSDLVPESARITEAPYLSISLSASTPHISVSGNSSGNSDITITSTLHYHGEPHDRPITFQKGFSARYALLIWPEEGESDTGPQEIIQQEPCGLGAWPWESDPDLKSIPICDDTLFQSLAPGECAETVWRGFEGYAEEFLPGRKYTFQYVGGVVRWWDWGTMEDHKDKSVGLHKTSHRARPRIVIPASNALEFNAIE